MGDNDRQEVVKTSFAIFVTLIRVGVTVQNISSFSTRLMLSHKVGILFFQNLLGREHLPFNPPAHPHHFKAYTPPLPSSWEKQRFLRLVRQMQ